MAKMTQMNQPLKELLTIKFGSLRPIKYVGQLDSETVEFEFRMFGKISVFDYDKNYYADLDAVRAVVEPNIINEIVSKFVDSGKLPIYDIVLNSRIFLAMRIDRVFMDKGISTKTSILDITPTEEYCDKFLQLQNSCQKNYKIILDNVPPNNEGQPVLHKIDKLPKEKHGALVGCTDYRFSMGMQFNSDTLHHVKITKTLDSEVSIILEEKECFKSKYTKTFVTTLNWFYQIADFVERENLAALSMLEIENNPNFMMTDCSSSSYITLYFDDTDCGGSKYVECRINALAVYQNGCGTIIEQFRNLIDECVKNAQLVINDNLIDKKNNVGNLPCCPHCGYVGKMGKFCPECGSIIEF